MSEYKFIYVELSNERLPSLLSDIGMYKMRADDLYSLCSKMDWGKRSVTIDRSNNEKPIITGTLPDEIELESLYRRFRFFYLKKERCHYFSVLSLLSQASSNRKFQEICSSEKKSFYEEASLLFAFETASRQYSPEDIIDYWFNGFYFHGNVEKNDELDLLKNKIGEDGARIVLYNTVIHCYTKIRNLNYLLSDTCENNLIVKCPI